MLPRKVKTILTSPATLVNTLVSSCYNCFRMLYEAHISRFFNEYKGWKQDPQNSDYRLKTLRRDTQGNPTRDIAEAADSWTYRQARDFTKLCVESNVPDVNQRITGNVSNTLFINEIPVR